MNTTTKTRKVHVRADGSRFVIRKSHGMWEWDHGRASSHMDSVRFNIENAGGHIETEPNPNYRPELHYTKTMRRLFG